MRLIFPLPLAPLKVALSRFTKALTRRHPTILRRLGENAKARILIDVQDSPLLLLMEPSKKRVRAHRRWREPAHDAVIRGKLPDFLAMLHGTEDGDALFFSGQLEISGDTGAVLALRNALDDAELDLTEEIAAFTGPLGPLAKRTSQVAQRQTGLILSRPEEVY